MPNNNNQQYEERKLIYKIANNQMVFSISDNTNDFWDIENYNTLILKFVQFDKKSKKAFNYLPVYVDANEFRAICGSILSGTFSKINFGSKNDNQGSYISYGGSKKGGLAKKRVNGQLQPIIKNKPEARWLTMSFGKDGYFYVKGQAFNGKSQYGGAITKQGDAVIDLFYKMTQQDLLIMAQTVVSYLQARETISISRWIADSANNQKVG